MSGERVRVVAHTHWDREWYSPFELFRLRLVRLVDRLLDLLEAEPDYPAFLLDAQTVVLEDYLELRPEQEARLRRQLAAGRIEVGPWYVQPDESLVSGESLVRNFLLGRRLAGGSLDVGYLPDMFGHISQIPQFLRGFGIDTAILWRGISGVAPEFRWRGPDGSEVTVLHLPDATGYSMAHRLSADAVEARKQIEAHRDPASRAPCRLMLVGSDHVEPQRGLPGLLARLGPDVVGSGLAAYVDEVREGLPDDLPVVQGELRDTNRSPDGRFNFLLPNVLSSRLPLKLRNAQVERELVTWAEPLSALARWREGAPSSRAFLGYAWRQLLRNHPHDSIGGCSRDEVHRAMPARFDAAAQVARQVGDEAAARLALAVDTSSLPPEGRLVMVVNPTAMTRRETMELTVDLPPGQWRDLEATGPDGAPVAAQVVSVGDAFRTTGMPEPALFPVVVANPRAAPAPDSGWFTAFEGVRQVRLRLAADVPPLGYTTYRLRAVDRGRVNRGSLRAGPLAAANGILALEVDTSGAVQITQLATGREWRNCLLLQDGGDAGDGYTYAPPPEDAVCTWRPRGVAVVEDGPLATTFRLQGDFVLPVGLEPDRRRRAAETAALPVALDLTLAAGAPLVDLRLRFTNTVRDHRLRLVVPTGLRPTHSHAEGQWDVVRRPTAVTHPPEGVWIEDASPYHPTHGFVDAIEGGAGFAALAFGLREYELTPAGELCLTVCRAVGHLGAPRPLTIVSGAGPGIRTPDAQMQGVSVEVQAALAPHDIPADIWSLSRAWQNPCRAYPQSRHPGARPLRASWLEVPDGLDVSACKEADEGEGFVLRLHNPGDAPRGGLVRLGGRVAVCGLDERPRGEAEAGQVRVEVPPKGLVTLRWSP